MQLQGSRARVSSWTTRMFRTEVALNLKLKTFDPKPQTQKPNTLNPKPQTLILHPKP